MSHCDICQCELLAGYALCDACDRGHPPEPFYGYHRHPWLRFTAMGEGFIVDRAVQVKAADVTADSFEVAQDVLLEELAIETPIRACAIWDTGSRLGVGIAGEHKWRYGSRPKYDRLGNPLGSPLEPAELTWNGPPRIVVPVASFIELSGFARSLLKGRPLYEVPYRIAHDYLARVVKRMTGLDLADPWTGVTEAEARAATSAALASRFAEATAGSDIVRGQLVSRITGQTKLKHTLTKEVVGRAQEHDDHRYVGSLRDEEVSRRDVRELTGEMNWSRGTLFYRPDTPEDE